MAGKTIHAAGGIVVRKGARPLIAVVQRSKDDLWVLPRGKLKSTERPIDGARREVVEETGHRVKVREFLGAITYRAQGRPKVVQFWRMQAKVRPSYDLMKDIAAVEWLPLKAAIRRLSYPLEKLFLGNVGRLVIGKRTRRRKTRAAKTKAAKSKTAKSKSANSKSANSMSAKPRTRRKSQKPSRAAAKAKAKRVAPRRVRAKTRLHLKSSATSLGHHKQTGHVERRSVLQRVLGTLSR